MCKETRFSCAFNADGSDSCFVGDVEATIDFGFASLKIDSCGIQRNMTEYARLFNESGHALVLENCHNGNPYNPVRGAHDNVECPMNLFRTSGDIRPQWGSILSNLMTTVEECCVMAIPPFFETTAIFVEPPLSSTLHIAALAGRIKSTMPSMPPILLWVQAASAKN